jgi:hypothetical protein
MKIAFTTCLHLLQNLPKPLFAFLPLPQNSSARKRKDEIRRKGKRKGETTSSPSHLFASEERS